MAMPSREELLGRVRQKMKEKSQYRRDPDEFRCPPAGEKATLEYYFYVLPELQVGDQCKGGGTNEHQNELWYYENGHHMLGNKQGSLECPRMHDGGECAMCTTGFELMRDNQNKDYRRQVAKRYLPISGFAVNIYFPNIAKNPEAVRGKVMWYNAGQTVQRKFEECFNNDNPGDETDPKANGVFYHPYEGCYQFKLVAKNKGGYNTYEESIFLPTSFGPLVKAADGSPDTEKIEQILAQRHLLQSKFSARQPEKIEQALQAILDHEQGNEGGNQGEEIITNEAPKPKVVGQVKTAPVAKPAVKPMVKPVAKPMPVPEPEPEAVAETVAETAESVAETVETPAEETAPVETVETPAEETAPVEAEAPAEETAPVEEAPPPPPPAPKPVVKPVVKPAVPAALTVKPAAPAAKPAGLPAAARPAPKPAAAAVADEDASLASLLGAIKSKKK